MDRRNFLKLVAGAVGAQTLLSACAGGYLDGSASGGVSGAPKLGGNCAVNGTAINVASLHQPNHDLEIPAADVQLGVEQTYMLGDGGSGHTHDVTVTAADFAKLKLGQGVQILSTGPGHTHVVTINCV